jgi:hypothetical protein
VEIKVRPSHLTCVSDMVMKAGADEWIAIKRARDNPPKLNREVDAGAFLYRLLSDGQLEIPQIYLLARQAGISKRRMRQAAKETPLTTSHAKDGKWFWGLR